MLYEDDHRLNFYAYIVFNWTMFGGGNDRFFVDLFLGGLDVKISCAKCKALIRIRTNTYLLLLRHLCKIILIFVIPIAHYFSKLKKKNITFSAWFLQNIRIESPTELKST